MLVPLDGSPFAEHALPLALSIARRANARIELLHVHPPLAEVHPEYEPFLPMDGPFIGEIKTRQRRYLEEVESRLRGVVPNVAVTCVVKEGAVAPAIQAAAGKDETDLVVMTTHGRSAGARFWLGSVADALLRDLPVPLLLVRPGTAPADVKQDVCWKKILVPLDGSDFAEHILDPGTGEPDGCPMPVIPRRSPGTLVWIRDD